MEEAYELAAEELGSERHLERLQGGYTGVLARLDTKRAGPKLGFRFDIDGLPIQESESKDHLPASMGFSSINANMHACGHDGHMAMGLGLAKRLAKNRASLKGEIYLAFQPAEEGVSGGYVFSQLPQLQNLDIFLAIHLGIYQGRRFVTDMRFLSSKKFIVHFLGSSAHAAFAPQKGRNALQAACTAVTNLYSIARHGEGATRINIGDFHSYNPKNVIADKASFTLEVRGENNDICDYMVNSTMNVLASAGQMYKVELDINDQGSSISAPASPGLKEMVKGAALEAGLPMGAILDHYLGMGCEDAPFIMREVQNKGGEAAYLCLGTDTRGGHHNPEFDFDEDLMLWGVRILWQLIEREATVKKD